MRAAKISILAASVLVAVAGLAQAQPYHEWRGDFAGRWWTNEGDMHVEQDGSHISGSYSKRGGRIEGRVAGDHASGVWAQDFADRPCFYERLGSHHWGRFEWRLSDDGRRFYGRWSYCDNDLSHGWSGDRRD